MQILTHCWEAEEVVTELTEVLQFNNFIRWILKFKMLSLTFHLAGSYDESGPANRVSYDATVANLQSRWDDEHSLTRKASYLFAYVQLSRVESFDIIATIFSWLSSQSAWHLLPGQALRPGGRRGDRLQLQQLRARRRCFRSQLRCCQLWHVNKKTSKTEQNCSQILPFLTHFSKGIRVN